MSYITLVEYQTLFPGDDIAQSDFDVLSDISSNIVNRCTYGKIDNTSKSLCAISSPGNKVWYSTNVI